MCTLWQRLGRAVRNFGLKGVGLVFVEAKHFDSEPKKPPDKGRGKKRKTADTVVENPSKQARGVVTSPTHRRNDTVAVLTPSINTAPATRPSDDLLEFAEFMAAAETGGIEPASDQSLTLLGEHAEPLPSELSLTDREESLRALYREAQKGSQTRAIVKQKKQDLDLELQDFVNAKARGLKCRRIPLKLYFNSDKAGEFACALT